MGCRSAGNIHRQMTLILVGLTNLTEQLSFLHLCARHKLLCHIVADRAVIFQPVGNTA